MRLFALIILLAYATMTASALADPLATTQPSAADTARCARAESAGLRDACLKTYSIPALVFPTAAETMPRQETGDATRPGLFKPEGNGPFPAIVLLHDCAGLGSNIPYWARAALTEGYAVLVVDSYEARGLSNGRCAATEDVPTDPAWLRVRDAYDALAYLARLPFIDSKRVAAVGFGQGGRAAYLLASGRTAQAYAPKGLRYAATVALYGACVDRKSEFVAVRNDDNRPLLALLGGQDEEGDVRECLPRLNAVKDKGAPVEWHIFPEAGHAWDQTKFATPVKKTYAGASSGRVLYAYSQNITDESRERAFAFLARAMAPPKRR